jgi:hypothetical protein
MSVPTPQEMAGWPLPNYVNPETRVAPQLGVIITGTIAMVVFVVGRVISRLKMQANFLTDDYIIFVAAVCLFQQVLQPIV